MDAGFLQNGANMISVEFNCTICGITAVRKYPVGMPIYCSVKCRQIGLNRLRWSGPRKPKPEKPPLTASRLRKIVSYDPETGLFIRLSGRHAGPTGMLRADGYVNVGIDGKMYRAHRLAWLYMTGSWPSGVIDHVDLSRDNNRWSNLREANMTQNRANTRARSDNACGLKGVSWDADASRWRAQIQMRGKKISLGRYSTPEDAHAAYGEAAEKYFKAFARSA